MAPRARDSTTELNDTLGEFGSWSLQAVVDDPKNIDSITIQLETSADGRNWAPKNAQPEVSGAMGAGTTTVLQGRDPGIIGAGMALIRLKISLFGSLSAPSAHVKVWIRGGDQAGSFLPCHLTVGAWWRRTDHNFEYRQVHVVESTQTWRAREPVETNGFLGPVGRRSLLLASGLQERDERSSSVIRGRSRSWVRRDLHEQR